MKRFNHKVAPERSLFFVCVFDVFVDWKRAFAVSRFSLRELGGHLVSRFAAA